MLKTNPVSVLQQRVLFLDSIAHLALLCNWQLDDVMLLREHVNGELIDINNFILDVYEDTQNPGLTKAVWDDHLEDLRHWLGLVLGININYI